jgi:hypothetical protein
LAYPIPAMTSLKGIRAWMGRLAKTLRQQDQPTRIIQSTVACGAVALGSFGGFLDSTSGANTLANCGSCSGDTCEKCNEDNCGTFGAEKVGSTEQVRCVEWDGIPPAHCAAVVGHLWQYWYIYEWRYCFKLTCSSGIPYSTVCLDPWTAPGFGGGGGGGRKSMLESGGPK